MTPSIETFPALDELAGIRHGFVARDPAIEVTGERTAVLARLHHSHDAARRQLGLGDMRFITAQQVHGNGVATVDENSPRTIPGVDALVTRTSGISLGIYVADCCAVFLVDPQQRCVGLVHSGKKGTEAGAVPAAIAQMRAAFDADPEQMIVQLSPCIRPPDYEVDFSAEIVRQCRQSGIRQVHDCGHNTASDLQRYYSYRVERGRTGRMLALIALV